MFCLSLKRSRLIYIVLAVSILAIFSLSFKGDGRSPPASAPNILLIVIDDLNDWVGYMNGHPQARTPNLDELAEDALIFTNAHAAAPSCGPSRTAMLTGVSPFKSGMYTNHQNEDGWRQAMTGIASLPEYLKENGYYVLGAGKIFHFPDPTSWDRYYLSKRKHRPAEEYASYQNQNGLRSLQFDWGPVPQSTRQMSDYKVVKWAGEQLRRGISKPFSPVTVSQPFFMAVGIFRPHLPWYVPREYFDGFKEESIELPPTYIDDLKDLPKAGMGMIRSSDHLAVSLSYQWQAAIRGYLASIAFADAMLGRLLSSLEASPYAENTIVIVTSDHGWHLGEKAHWRKYTLWERATKIPFLIKYPDSLWQASMLSPGSRIDTPINLIDLFPTVTDMAGLNAPSWLDGQSLLPLIEQGNSSVDRYSITTMRKGNHAVRSKHWRLIHYADGSEELYDHRTDPNEFFNVIDQVGTEKIASLLRSKLPSE